MGTAERVAVGIVAIGFATTLLLPDRQTAKVGKTIFDGFIGSLRAAMGR